jgi:pimeloyl-ACP methyl ester carboxylesterase
MFSTRSGQRRVSLILALGLAALLVGLVAVPASSAGGAPTCRQVAFSVPAPVTASNPDGDYTLRGTLCRPGAGQPRAAVLLVHGSTYSRTYWDPGVDPDRYSALRLLAVRGYLTLAIDRLGSGESSRPANELATADASASALAEVAAELRKTRTRSGKLFLVGHSSGSSLAIRTAVKHPGTADGLVTTGFLHNLPPADLFSPMLYPAAEDPMFAGDPTIPAGYVTTRPLLRSQIFYYGFTAEAKVADLDERVLKDAMPEVDAGGFLDEVGFGEVGPFAPELRIPVLVVIGNRDVSFCSALDCPEAAAERASYPNVSDYQLIVRDHEGHSLNLHRDADQTTELIRTWLAQHS